MLGQLQAPAAGRWHLDPADAHGLGHQAHRVGDGDDVAQVVRDADVEHLQRGGQIGQGQLVQPLGGLAQRLAVALDAQQPHHRQAPRQGAAGARQAGHGAGVAVRDQAGVGVDQLHRGRAVAAVAQHQRIQRRDLPSVMAVGRHRRGIGIGQQAHATRRRHQPAAGIGPQCLGQVGHLGGLEQRQPDQAALFGGRADRLVVGIGRGRHARPQHRLAWAVGGAGQPVGQAQRRVVAPFPG